MCASLLTFIGDKFTVCCYLSLGQEEEDFGISTQKQVDLIVQETRDIRRREASKEVAEDDDVSALYIG